MKFVKSTDWPVGLWFIVAVYLFFSAAVGWGLWGAFKDVRQQLRSDLYGLTVDVVRTVDLTSRYLSELESYLDPQNNIDRGLMLQHMDILIGRQSVLMVPIKHLALEPAFKALVIKTLGDYNTALVHIKALLVSGSLAGANRSVLEDQMFAAEDAISLLYTRSQGFIQGSVSRQHNILNLLSIMLVGLVVALLVVLGGLVLMLRQVRLARGQAEKANADKSVFLAAASHDMRQPLQAMRLFLYALKNGQASPGNHEIVENLEKTTASLGHILDSVLDLSRLEAGVVKIDKRTFSVNTIFNNLLDEFAPIAADKGLRLSVVKCSRRVHTDPVLVENILRNFIANAIKNTKRGRILIGCRCAGAGAIKIQVWDTGKGIASDQQAKIFDEFYQLGVNPRDSQRGLGLGLSIVHKVAALLNHELGLVSKLGRGSVFFVTVPLEKKSSVSRLDQSRIEQRPRPENLSIIVIDDDDDVRKSLVAMLTAANNVVVSGACVEALGKDHSGGAPDIIIADYRLGHGQTGVEAISSLCRFYEKNIPAILLTGDTAPECLQKISQSGYALLHKPIHGDALFMHIQEVLMQGSSGGVGRAAVDASQHG